MSDKAKKPLITRRDVAKQISTCYHTVLRLEEKGELKPLRLSRRVIRYEQTEVDRFIKTCRA